MCSKMPLTKQISFYFIQIYKMSLKQLLLPKTVGVVKASKRHDG